jgi:hypothetical protein
MPVVAGHDVGLPRFDKDVFILVEYRQRADAEPLFYESQIKSEGYGREDLFSFRALEPAAARRAGTGLPARPRAGAASTMR